MSSVRRRLVLVAAATIAVDLASKAAAVRWLIDPVDLGVVTVRATENSGVVFGIGADQPFALVAALTGLVVVGMAVGAWRGLLGGPVGAGLVVGGGAANRPTASWAAASWTCSTSAGGRCSTSQTSL